MPQTPYSSSQNATTSHDPRDGTPFATVENTSPAQLAEVLDASTAAAAAVGAAPPAVRRAWLNRVADALEEHLEHLVATADRETALGTVRLRGELLRTADQLRFYGDVAADGAYLQVTIDRAQAGSPSLARCAQPLGPVAVFGASNFPFAFGILGNDTASAIAAGCPVVAKAHPAHARTCEELSTIAVDALAAAGAPAGTFATVHGYETGPALVRDPRVRAVGFTGSQAGGLALWREANAREVVIPFFAEMGTVNPVVMTRAAAARVGEIATAFVGSFTLGSGQFCTKPGLLLAPAGHGVSEAVASALRDAAPTPVMLTEGIARSVEAGLAQLQAAGARLVASVDGTGAGWSAPAAVLVAPAEALVAGSRLLEECFGAVALVVEYATADERDRALEALQGCLAASVLGTDDDPDVPALLAALSTKAGRVMLNDWPTGVAWTWAQQHGGPWPATTRPEATSVGAAALERFVRPVTFQSVPPAQLPAPYRDVLAPTNPLGVPRRVDGVWERP